MCDLPDALVKYLYEIDKNIMDRIVFTMQTFPVVDRVCFKRIVTRVPNFQISSRHTI